MKMRVKISIEIKKNRIQKQKTHKKKWKRWYANN